MKKIFVVLAVIMLTANISSEAKPRKPVISLFRGACYGTCPIYELKIYSDGVVEFEGQKFVAVEGKAKGKISSSEVKKLLAEAKRMGYMKLKSKYDKIVNPDGTVIEVTDVPTIVTSVTMNGKIKKISNTAGAPEKLRAFERMIDELANSRKWVMKQ